MNLSQRNVSGLHSLFCLVDLALIYVNVSVVDPHRVWSQLVCSSIGPCLPWHVGNSPSDVVLRDLCGSFVLLIVKSFKLQMLKILSFKRIKSKIGTNTNNIILFFTTTILIIIIGNKTSLISSNSPLTESWKRLKRESELITSFSGIFDSIMIFPPGISKWVVMGWPMLIEMDCIWICLSIINLIIHLGNTILLLVWYQRPFYHWLVLVVLRMD